MERKQQTEKYESAFCNMPGSWSHLVADYIRNELKSSKEEIDRRPLLHVRVGSEPGDHPHSHRLDDPSAIVCLKRGAAELAPNVQEAQDCVRLWRSGWYAWWVIDSALKLLHDRHVQALNSMVW
jgi:hypothetical protein